MADLYAGFFYAGYAAVLTPSFGVRAAYGEDVAQYNNALGFFLICEYPPNPIRCEHGGVILVC